MPKRVTPVEKSERVFSIPQVIVICAFIASLVGLGGWILNLEIRKADRVEIIGRAYRENLERTLDSIQEDLRYIRRRVDQHIAGSESFYYRNGNGDNGSQRRRNNAE